jgi:hypothetical protein
MLAAARQPMRSATARQCRLPSAVNDLLRGMHAARAGRKRPDAQPRPGAEGPTSNVGNGNGGC